MNEKENSVLLYEINKHLSEKRLVFTNVDKKDHKYECLFEVSFSLRLSTNGVLSINLQ